MVADIESLLVQRYGGSDHPRPEPWNDTIRAMLSHHSTRHFRPDPIPESTLSMLIACAQSAATSSNLQPWSVIAVTDPGIKSTLSDVADHQSHVRTCPLLLVWLADLTRVSRIVGEAEEKDSGIPFLDTFLAASLDTALAAQNVVIAAASLGLSTVYIGGMRNDPARVAKLLRLPLSTAPVFGLCLGYSSGNSAEQIKPRLPQSIVLHHERYDDRGWPAHEQTYDQTVRAHNVKVGRPPLTWAERVRKCVGTPAALCGRDGLKSALLKLGFQLR
jgi:nitroreductase